MGSAVLTNAVATTVSQANPTTNFDAKTALGTRTSSGIDAIGYIWWPRPFPLKATIISAKIFFYTTAMAETGTHTFTFQRLAQTFSASRITWNTRPTALQAGTKTVSKTGAQPSKQEWQLDITDWAQSVSNGGSSTGIKFQTSDAIIRHWYAENHPEIAFRPRLEVTWSDAPATPTGLSPSGGRRVGVSRPVVRANYLDVSGATALQAVNVQTNATDVWTAPTFDSGTVLTSLPELDLAATAFPAMADQALVYWRVRFQDAAGLWSNWSASTSFVYDNQGTLVLNSPDVDPGLVNQVNLVSNPKAGTATTNYGVGLSGTGDAGTLTRQTTGGPSGVATYARLTYTATGTSPTGGMHYSFSGTDANLNLIPGDFRSGGLWVRCSKAQRIAMYMQFPDAGGTSVLSVTTVPVVLAANTWTWISFSQSQSVPALSTRVRILVYAITGTGGLPWVTGDTLDVTGVMVVPGVTGPASFFDGDTSAGGGFSYRWTGAADASSSEQYTPGPSSQLKVEDATPVLIWTFTGETQAAYQVQIYHLANNVRVTDWDSGKVTSTINSLTVPAGKINEPSGTVYTLVVRVWDNKQREATAGNPVYVEAVAAFTFVPKMAISPATNLTATAGDPEPKVTLNWYRGIAPDRFNVLRNGKVIAAAQDPADLLSGPVYAYTDNSPSPQRALTYSIQAVVNNQASASNPTAVVTVRSKGIWLREPVSGLRVVLTGKDDRSFTLGEQSAILQSIAQNANKVAINQSLGGLEGRIEGDLSGVYGRTAQQWRDDFLKMRALRVKRFWLTVGDYTFSVVAQNFSYAVKALPVPSFHVGFDFYQQDSVSSAYLGS